MKNTFKNLMLLASLPVVCMCTKNADLEPASEQKTEKVTIIASIPETKVSVSAGGAEDPALVLAWQQTDQLVVKGTSESVFTVESITNAHKAEFTGTAVSGTSFDVYYPDAGILTRSYENQVQDGNASTAHLQFNAMAEGLSSYESVAFTKVNGAVKLVVKVPATVTEVSSLSIKSLGAEGTAQDVFYKTNDAAGEKTSTITLGFTEGTAASSGVLTAYAMVSWNEVELASGSKLEITLSVPGKSCTYQKVITLTKATTVAGGKTVIVDLSSAAALNHVLAGAGTQADPYLVYDVEDLKMMDGLLAENQVKCFKLMSDVDMAGVTDWVASNQASPYNKGINFDGDGHTIRNFTFSTSGVYAGFIGVLYGEVKNLTFVDANVSGTKALGVVCGYAGTGSYVGNITNVTVKDATVTQNGSAHSGLLFGTNGVAGTYTNCHTSGTLTLSSTAAIANSGAATGGIAGCSVASTYNRCSFVGTINACRLCGGIVGYEKTAGSNVSECWTDVTLNISKINSRSSEETGGIVGFLQGGTIQNCYTKGKITILDQLAGGIVADVITNSTVENCWSSIEFKSNRAVGGIVARAAGGKWDSTIAKVLTLKDCVYMGSKIDVSGATTANGSSGAVVGFTSLKNVLSNSWRPADENWTFTSGSSANTPADQDYCTGSNWVAGTTPQIGTAQYNYPYWGKAADADATVSSIVTGKGLEWSTAIWDLSGSYPKLINNPE